MVLTSNTRQRVREVLDAEFAAMIDGDVDALGDLLASDATLTHITGMVQTKQGWLNEVAVGSMRYHSIEVVDVEARGSESTPTLIVRTRTFATIWGSRGIWNLRLRVMFERRGDRWVIARTVESAW